VPLAKNTTNKKPAELYASAGLKLVLLANSAAHSRRRAMRVMAVMMVASQHERFKLRDGMRSVNTKDSMRMIGFRNAIIGTIRHSFDEWRPENAENRSRRRN
jgi:hypothetical protein